MRLAAKWGVWNVRWALALLVPVALWACNSSSSSPTAPSSAIVEFAYLAATAIDPAVVSQFPACTNGVGRTHIHPGWRGFARVDMTSVGNTRWEITFSDVPVGAEQRIRVSDPNTCAVNPTGASVQNVFANGVLLQRVVDTPGSGTEPGLAFSVNAAGVVTP